MPESRIFYLASDSAKPSGGEKDCYQHVDVLNDAGFNAYALHEKPGYRHTWFDNSTPVMTVRELWNTYRMDRDYIVMPEPGGRMISSVPGRKVIFNRNVYHGFAAFGTEVPHPYPYADPSVVATFGVSDHNCEHLRFAFPGTRVYRMYHHIDVDLFAWRPLDTKRPRIVHVSKAKEEIAVLYHTLMARGAAGLNHLADFDWMPLTGRSERETAALLEDTLLLISLSTHEGLPRTLVEGMSCGCLVMAYGSGSGLEYLPARHQYAQDDFISMVKAIEAIAAAYPVGLGAWRDTALEGRRVAESFTRARQSRTVVNAWTEIFATECAPAMTRAVRA